VARHTAHTARAAASSARSATHPPTLPWRARCRSRIDIPWHPLLQDATLHLIALDRFEQRLEVAFAETFIALALDDLEKDRADHVVGEDLQQQALLGFLIRIDQDLVLRQPRHVF